MRVPDRCTSTGMSVRPSRRGTCGADRRSRPPARRPAPAPSPSAGRTRRRSSASPHFDASRPGVGDRLARPACDTKRPSRRGLLAAPEQPRFFGTQRDVEAAHRRVVVAAADRRRAPAARGRRVALRTNSSRLARSCRNCVPVGDAGLGRPAAAARAAAPAARRPAPTRRRGGAAAGWPPPPAIDRSYSRALLLVRSGCDTPR